MSSAFAPYQFQPGWSQTLPAAARWLGLARERNTILCLDAEASLYLLNRSGAHQAHVCLPEPLIGAACADDGSIYAAASSRRLWLLTPDLRPCLDCKTVGPVQCVALDPFGQYAATADAAGRMCIYDRFGQKCAEGESPRPLHFLSFVATAPFLVGAADHGLVVCFDVAGKCTSRAAFVGHIGSLSVTGEGEVVLAAFSDGVRRYSVSGARLPAWALPEPCRLAASSFDGARTLASSFSNRIFLLDHEGSVVADHALPDSPNAIAIGALGEFAMAALADGSLRGLEIRPSRP